MQKEQNLSQKDVISPIKARLQEYFKVAGLNNSRFEKQCGLYNGFVKELDQQIRFESLAKIASGCPNLNLGWLFSGIGPMSIGETQPIIEKESLSVNLVGKAQTVLIGNWDEMADVLRKVMSEMK